MIRSVFRYVLLCFLLLRAGDAEIMAQGMHFSQYFNAPMYTNPANTGFIPTSDYRIGAHHRTQGFNGSPVYTTMGIYGDMQLLRNKIAAGWIGLGGMILNDVAGVGKLRTTKVNTSIAYHQMLGFSSLLSAGFGLTYADKGITLRDLNFSENWNGRFFEAKIPADLSSSFFTSNTAYFDLSAGVNYSFFPNDNFYVHSGLSLQHINKPKESFFTSSTEDARIAMRTTFFMDAIYKVDNNIILSPGLYYSQKAKTSEFLFGAHANLNVSGNGSQQLIIGLYSRLGDAVIPAVGYQWGKFKFTFTFDIPSTREKVANRFTGTELYLQYGGMYTLMSTGKQTFCPTFDN